MDHVDSVDHGFVIMPAFMNSTEHYGNLSRTFAVEEEGQFELEFELKVENFDAKLTAEENQQLIVLLVFYNSQEEDEKQALQSQQHYVEKRSAMNLNVPTPSQLP